MQLTKEEIKIIRRYEPKFHPYSILSSNEARGQTINYLIIVSHGCKQMHDSGYPFITVIGCGSGSTYYDLGQHDVIHCESRCNIDSYGKNVFRLLSKYKPWKVDKCFISVSSFSIGDSSVVTEKNTLS